MYKKLLLAASIIFPNAQAQGLNITDFFKGQSITRTISGMFTTYQCGEHLYWEVPDSLIGREFVVMTTLINTPARPDRSKEKKFGYAGDMVGPVFFRFRKCGDELWLMDPSHERVITDPLGSYANIARQSENERLYHILPIKANGTASNLIEVGDLLENFSLFTLDIVSYDLQLGMRTRGRDKIKTIQGYNDRLLLQISRTYANSPLARPRQSASTSYEATWETGLYIGLLPANRIEPIPNISNAYFTLGKEYFDGNHPPQRKSFIKHWRLEVRPEDRERYERGELVEPIKPITFYIDPNMPAQYVDCVIEAVRDWRPAFEKAGFKNAIDARLLPQDSTAANYIYDATYPYISWKISPSENAYGPSPCEPHSGEIFTAHIAVFSSVLNLLQKWYFVQCGANDSAARDIIMPDSIQCEMIKLVLTHEIGHTLGLEHNFLGSAHFTIDQLRDEAFLKQHGITTSIMDYVRCNYALRPSDHVTLPNRRARLGEYDCWAIASGYRIFPGNTAAERQKNREEWMKKEQHNPLLRFGGGNDVMAQAEDLGSDHIAVNIQGIKNMQLLCADTALWKPASQVDRYVLSDRYHAMTEHFQNWVRHIYAHLGGKRPMTDSTATLFRPEKEADCRRALDFICTYVVRPPHWLFSPSVIQPLDIKASEAFEKCYVPLINELIDALCKVDIASNAGTDMLTAQTFLERIRQDLFSEWRQGKFTDELRFRVQHLYIDGLIRLIHNPRQPISSRLLAAVVHSLRQIKTDGQTYFRQNTICENGKQIEAIIQSIPF